MSNLQQARQLLIVAQRDLKALAGMMDRQIFADEIFGFHIQQAAEKCLKAWLAAMAEVYPLTHDLGVLLQQLEQTGCDVTPYWDLLEYNAFAVQLRYDAIGAEDVPINRTFALAQVQHLYARVETYVNAC